MAKKNAPPPQVMQQVQQMAQQGYQQLQRRPQPNIEAMRAKYGMANPQDQWARMNQMQQRYGQPVIDYAARQQQLQQLGQANTAKQDKAQQVAEALRNYELQQAAAIDAFNQRGGSMSDA